MSDDPLAGIRRRVDDVLEQAVADGEFDDLPGAGKPLSLDQTPHVPADMRTAYRLLNNAGMAPDWIELGRRIQQEIEGVHSSVRAHHDRVQMARQALLERPAGEFSDRFRRITRLHRDARAPLQGRLLGIGRMIDAYDVLAPGQIGPIAFRRDAELARFDACWRWAPPSGSGRSD